jgi:hypothetical protein
MSVTTNSLFNVLFEEVSADLIAYYDNSVLLPSPTLIVNSYNLEGAVGNKMRIPVTNAWGLAATGIGEGTDISLTPGTNPDFAPAAVDLAVNKRGAFSYVNMEALEDGGVETIRNAVVTRLSRMLAQSTDEAGFKVMLNNTETAPANASDLDGTTGSNIELVNTITGNQDICPVFSPEAMGYAVKRSAELKSFEDVSFDRMEMVSTLRNGFAQIDKGFIKAVAGNTAVGATAQKATLGNFGEAVAKLRDVNAPTDGSGFYYAAISPAVELQLVDQLTHIANGGTVGSLSALGDRVLIDALVGQASGIRFLRSNNIVKNIAA